MNKLIGFIFQPEMNAFLVTLAATGEQLIIEVEDFDSFIVEQGFAARGAYLGGSYVNCEVIEELGFTLPHQAEAMLA
ncbi:hypothetical protein BpOF4_04505 [Alkalihalophilus pseudofirmus OF4]|uniref:Uncharacterized protein n=1 Tax=Alkalihalophilus pseudofirmus (strain ATCC BAA-2126 / JCM 17055 / OF4) TaxID=398511 RepID=D3FYT2_ALKPO|nr:hypothetical protein [Alkalihalophilus pseudofirmus]ADC48965.1 hypothetical protein BpOF4_04505 [Alkalihalophilus pseudofirmus OF4]